MKYRIVITVSGGVAYPAYISPFLQDKTEVVIQDYDIEGNEDHLILESDEDGKLCSWEKWDGTEIEPIPDEFYQKIDAIFEE
jgi:hypothetical protein